MGQHPQIYRPTVEGIYGRPCEVGSAAHTRYPLGCHIRHGNSLFVVVGYSTSGYQFDVVSGLWVKPHWDSDDYHRVRVPLDPPLSRVNEGHVAEAES